MNKLIAIIKKEFSSYLNSLTAYIVIAVFLAIANFFFFRAFFIAGEASMRGYFGLLPWFFLFIIPAITMRIWSEEKKMGTVELLYTWPLKQWEPVIGKFIAAWLFVGLIILLTVTVPITIVSLGNPDIGVIVASYLASFLMAGAFVAIGSWLSSITDNQIVAFVLTIALCFLLFFIGETYFITNFPPVMEKLLSYLSLNTHFQSISRGVIDSRDVIYYFSIIALFLSLNNYQVKKRD